MSVFRRISAFSPNAWLVMATSFLAGLGLGGFRLFFNFYLLSLGYDAAVAGTLQTVESLAAIAAAVPAAYLADRLPGRWLLVAVTGLTAASFAGFVVFPALWALIAFRMLIGVTMASREVVLATFLLANTTREERQWVFSFNFGIMMTATFVGNTLGGFLPGMLGAIAGVSADSAEAYRLALTVLAGLTAIGIVPSLFLKSSEADNVTVPELPWVILRRHGRVLWRYLVPNLSLGLGAGLMMPFMNLYFRGVYRQPDPVIGAIFAAGSISMAVAQFIGPALADRIGKIRAVVLAQSLSVPFLMILGLGAFLVPAGIVPAGVFLVPAVIAFNMRIGLMNLGNPLYQTFVLERVPAQVQAMSVSMLSISFQFGWFVMPQVSGWLQVGFGDYGFVPVFSLVIMFYIVAITMERQFFMADDDHRDSVIRERSLQELAGE